MFEHLRTSLIHCLVLLVPILAVAGCSAPASENRETDPRPNVVLILIDTFRPDHLGINGYERQTAPFLEGLMARSTVFRRAWSTSSWTAPATSSVFTALYPTRHGVTTGFLAHQRQVDAFSESEQTITLNRLPAEIETLPELMQAAGWGTYGMATNINIGHEIGFDRGFDRFNRNNGREADEVASELEGWRKDMESQPYFLYLHLNDVHAPYRKHQPWYQDEGDELTRTVSAYNSEISWLDGVLGKLYDDFAWDQNTLLMVVSDHGEEFRERGRIGHEFSLFDEVMRVLMVVSGEDLGIPAMTFDVNTSLVDVLPTLLDLADVELTTPRDGLSLAPLIRSETTDLGERMLFAHRKNPRGRQNPEDEHLWAVVDGSWKLIAHRERRRLFDLDRDPDERRNRRKRQPQITAELEGALDDFRAAGFTVSGESTEVELDQKTLDELEALGYIQ